MSGKNDEEKGVLSRLLESAPASVFPNIHIEINNFRELIAEGCLGVLLCEENQIKLNMGKQIMLITGCELSISSMFGKNVCISGKIVSVEFI